MSLKSVAALAIAAVMTAGVARAEIVHFSATLTGADEVPANSSAGHGQLTAELETVQHVLTYRATYTGLSGPPTMAHFHGPADPGANANVQIPAMDTFSPIRGAVSVTPDQQEQLLAGKWYFNIHTKDHPGGEIRGQVKREN